jgi:transglutaminase-like putative cysteine protease
MLVATTPIFRTTLIDGIPGGRAGSFDTVRRMRALITETSASPEIMQLATTLICMTPQRDQLSEVDAIFDFVRGRVRYVRDVVGLETLSDPRMTIKRLVGDCDDKTTLLGALFQSVGYPVRLVLTRYGADRNFEHVYLDVLVNSAWLPADATEFRPLGWEAPDATETWIERV